MLTSRSLPLLAATALLTLACQSTPVVVGDAIESHGDAPSPPTLEAHSDACMDYTVANTYLSELAAYSAELEKRAAAERGWRVLTELVVVQVEEYNPSAILPPPNLEIDELLEDRIIDTEGNTWLALDSWTCEPISGPYYIDSENAVFSALTDMPCASTEPIPVCGSWPVGGCGMQPRYANRLYARVPEDAHFILGGVPLELGELDTCYAFDPEGGYSYPP